MRAAEGWDRKGRSLLALGASPPNVRARKGAAEKQGGRREGLVPHCIDTDESYRIAFVALSGDIGLSDISALFKDIRERFSGQDYSALIDVSAADLHGDIHAVRTVANFDRVFTRIAVYAPSAVSYGIARAYEALSQLYRERRVAVFRERERALQWLMSAAAKTSL